ncbi:MAG TPA: STAS domain-containing protein [Anaerolineales bacterium]|nr:STAS domain-containing protein [Anaerolineales bacterium]
MGNDTITVVKLHDILMVAMPSDPGDSTISALQQRVLQMMEKYVVRGFVLDISAVETLDSFFARTVLETAKMVALMGGRMVVSGMRPSVAITATQLGLTLGGTLTALDVDSAIALLDKGRSKR